MQRISRGAVFWGAALVTAGVVVLAIQQGWVSDDVVGQALRWWPLFLIGAGVAIIFAGTLGVLATGAAGVLLGLIIGGFIGGGAANLPSACGNEPSGELQAFEEGSFSGSASVEIELDCVTLSVGGGPGDGWGVEADEAAADRLDLSDGDDELVVQDNDAFDVATERLLVAVTVPASEGTDLSTALNAGDATFDLGGGTWGDIDLGGNAVAMHVDLSGATAESFQASMNAGAMEIQIGDGTVVGPLELSANAGSFDVCAPEDIGLEVTVGSTVATGHNLEEAGLTEEGGVWRTRGFDSADTQVEIRFSGNAASFTLSAEGDCS
jgi:hypothetical protein